MPWFPICSRLQDKGFTTLLSCSVHFSLLPPSSRTAFTPGFMWIFSGNCSVVWSAETQPPG